MQGDNRTSKFGTFSSRPLTKVRESEVVEAAETIADLFLTFLQTRVPASVEKLLPLVLALSLREEQGQVSTSNWSTRCGRRWKRLGDYFSSALTCPIASATRRSSNSFAPVTAHMPPV